MATVATDPNSALTDASSALTDQVEPEGLYEVIDGRIVEKTIGVYENLLAAVFFGILDRHMEMNPVGWVVQEMIFDLRPQINRERRPDVAVVSFERWPRDRLIPEARSWAVVPDLAVEILSPTNTTDSIAEKLAEYFHVGVRQVWVVYPRHAWIYVYTSVTSVSVLAPGAELDDSDVLPGLRLSIKDLFEKAGQRR
jgi:Uma2 family endonuclease